MIGVMATAPAGEPVGTAYVGSHGGNMDCNLIAVGARVRLPVRVPGALFFVGDIHAAMGDGEVSGSGFEIGAKVRLRLDLEKGRARGWPSVETADRYATIASAPDFYAAAEIALRELIVWLGQRYRVDPLEAYMLATLSGDLRVNQACRSPVDISLRMEFPKL